MIKLIRSTITAIALGLLFSIPYAAPIDAAAKFDDSLNLMTIPNLPACTAANSGSSAAVSDYAGSIAWGAAVGTGGGTGIARVYCNGATWTVFAGGGSGNAPPPTTAMAAPSTTTSNATLGNYATGCPAHGGSCLVSEDQFTAASLDTSKWVPYLANEIGTGSWHRWNAGPNWAFGSPFSTGTGCGTAFSTTSPAYTSCNPGAVQQDDYLNPFPYGTSTNAGDGNHMLGGATNGNALSLIATPGKTAATQPGTLECPGGANCVTPAGGLYNYGWVWTSAGFSPISPGPFVCPNTGCYVQWRVQIPDVSQGQWPEFGFYADTPPSNGGGQEFDVQEAGFCNFIGVNNCGTTSASDFNHLVSSTYHGWAGTINAQCSQSNSNNAATDTGSGYGCQVFNPTDLSTGYHVYGIEYIPNTKISVWIDNALVGSWSGSSIGNTAYDLYMDLGMSYGLTYRSNQVWPTTEPVGTPPNVAYTLKVNDIQIYRLPGQ